MNLILSILVLVVLLVYVYYILERFTTTSVSEEEASEEASEEEEASITPSVKYFELNNQAKNLVNSYKYETQLSDIAKEQQEMRNNVRKIVDHAENVLDFTELNKEYLEKVYLQHSESE